MISSSGPISVSWLNAAGDVYSAQIMKDMGIADNCAYHVDQGISLDFQFISDGVHIVNGHVALGYFSFT